MEFPEELWKTEQEKQLIFQALDLFEHQPVIITDQLANSVFLNKKAEELYGQRGEAIVNRAVFSLLGFDSFEGMPQKLVDGLSGNGEVWRGFVKHPTEQNKICFAEASAIVHENLKCGMIRFDDTNVHQKQ